MPEFLSVYITTSSRNEAEHIARSVLEQRLAACANILGPIHSLFHWKEKIESAEEMVLIIKSRSDLYPQLEKRVKELHSYECPCIVAWPIVAGHAPYLEWIAKETKAS